MDEEDFVFIKQPVSKEDDKLFSDFLKDRKTKTLSKKKASAKDMVKKVA